MPKNLRIQQCVEMIRAELSDRMNSRQRVPYDPAIFAHPFFQKFWATFAEKLNRAMENPDFRTRVEEIERGIDSLTPEESVALSNRLTGRNDQYDPKTGRVILNDS